MTNKKLIKNTGDYHEYLIQSLHDPEECAAYLQIALEEYLEDNDTEVFLIALRNVTEARGGMAKLSKKTHLNRQNLYKILSKVGNPRLDTFGRIIKGLGFHLEIYPDK